jgi:hypothetical protein
MQAIARLEREERYGEAHKLLHALAVKYPKDRDWKAEFERLEGLALLDGTYRAASEAQDRGDRDAALNGMLRVIALRHDYRDALTRAYALATGVDPKQLQTDLEQERSKAKQAREQAAANLTRLQAANKAVLAYRDSEATNFLQLDAANKALEGERDAAKKLAAELTLERQKGKDASHDRDVLAATGAERARSVAFWKRLTAGAVVLGILGVAIGSMAARGDGEKTIDQSSSGGGVAESRDGASEPTSNAIFAGLHEQLKYVAQHGAFEAEGGVTVYYVSPSTDGGCEGRAAVGSYSGDFGKGPHFPPNTCAIDWETTLRNNAVNTVAPKGIMCVRYIGPDGGVLETKDSINDTGGGSRCSLGIGVNEDAGPVPMSMPVDASTAHRGIRSRLWHFATGEHRIELWWQDRKIAQERFVIDDGTR